MGRAFEVRKVAMGKTAAAKSKVYSRYGREILMAAKSGTPEPETNLALKQIIDKAKRDQVPTDIIKRAIERAKGGTEENYTPVRYEGFGVDGTMFIVDCLTDNINRTVAEVRSCFTKTGGKLGITGSVLHQFEHQCVFSLPNLTEDDVLEMVIEHDLNVKLIEQEEDAVTLYGDASDYNAFKQAIDHVYKDVELLLDDIMWFPMTTVEVTNQESLETLDKLKTLLDNLDDVQKIYDNIKN
jgi:YebC/PmpR family DNA-binding regulatory protein